MLIPKILKAFKAFVIGLVPGMFFRRVSKIGRDLNGSGEKYRRTRMAMVIALLALIGGCALGGYICLTILTPMLASISQGTLLLSIILSTAVPGLILMEFGFLLTRQFLRFASWLKYRKDTNVVNPTNREKYWANHIHYERLMTVDIFNQQKEEAQKAMGKLYREKQKIKNNPEGHFGELSVDQKSKCKAINYAAGVLRHDSINTLFKPISYLNTPTVIKAIKIKCQELKYTDIETDEYIAKAGNDLDEDHFKSKGLTKKEIAFLKTLILDSSSGAITP